MGNKLVVNKGKVVEEFENVLGHQVGNGAIQVLAMDGSSRIIFAPDDVTITLDDEASSAFKHNLDAQMQAAEAPVKKEGLKVVESAAIH